ncbi:MAG: HAD family hydrolase [Herbinix sp.]|nr:HAD family hydrolase [Herbinix sp.]
MENKNKAIFLDRDGTINVEKNYLYKIEEFEFLTGVIDGLKKLQELGYKLIIVTNQSGIARGYYSEKDYYTLTNWMLNHMKELSVNIDKVYFCPHHPNASVLKYRLDCDCRKPKLGLYKKAICDFNISLSQSYVIGNKICDCALCERTKCRGFLTGQNEKNNIIRDVKLGRVRNVRYMDSFFNCVEQIIIES